MELGNLNVGWELEPAEPQNPLLSLCLEGTNSRPKEVQGKYTLQPADCILCNNGTEIDVRRCAYVRVCATLSHM